jgi:hypothetical protein
MPSKYQGEYSHYTWRVGEDTNSWRVCLLDISHRRYQQERHRKALCVWLAELGILGAAFFVSSADQERQDLRSIVRPITYQLARLRVTARTHTTGAIQHNPDTVRDPIKQQVHHLLKVPLLTIMQLPNDPIAIN